MKKGAQTPQFRGDTYVSAMGRFNDLPAPVAALATQAERAGLIVEQEAILHDGQYAGYTIAIEQPRP